MFCCVLAVVISLSFILPTVAQASIFSKASSFTTSISASIFSSLSNLFGFGKSEIMNAATPAVAIRTIQNKQVVATTTGATPDQKSKFISVQPASQVLAAFTSSPVPVTLQKVQTKFVSEDQFVFSLFLLEKRLGNAIASSGGGGHTVPPNIYLSPAITSPAISWGNISGTLSSQSDLQAALDAKFSLADWYATTTGSVSSQWTTVGSDIYYSTGNVGVGTTSPSNFKLQVLGNIGPDADSTYNLGAGSLRFNNIYTRTVDGGGNTLTLAGGVNVDLYSGGSIRLRADSNGNVGIGTTTPQFGLTTGSAVLALSPYTDNTDKIIFNDTGTFQFGIRKAANAGIRVFGKVGGTNAVFDVVDRATYNNSSSDTVRFGVYGGGNIGIGTTSPFAKLAINPNAGDGNSFIIGSSSATSFVVANSGNVGIGTPATGAPLTIKSAATGNPSVLLTSGSSGIGLSQAGGIQFGYGSPDSLATNRVARIMAITQAGGGGDLYFDTAPSQAGAFDTKMAILRGGNVGIGTTTPMAKLTVVDTQSSGNVWFESSGTNTELNLVNTSTGGRRFGMGTGGNASFAANSLYLYDYTAAATRLLINSSGNVGIGTTTPAQLLNVYGGASPRIRVETTNSGILARSAGIEFVTNYNSGADTATSHIIFDYFGATNGHGMNFKSGRSGFSNYWFRNAADGVGMALIDTAYASGAYPTLATNMNAVFGASVGIGTTSPNTKLTIVDATASIASWWANSTTRYGMIGVGSGVVTGGGSTDFGIQANQNLLFATNGVTERMRITTTGNVGIGTTSPSEKLSVSSTSSGAGTNSVIQIVDTSYPTMTGKFGVYNDGSGAYVGLWVAKATPTAANYAFLADSGSSYFNAAAGGNVNFRINNTTQMILTSAGNIGIGTSTPQSNLHIRGADATLLFEGDLTDVTDITSIVSRQSGDLEFRTNKSSTSFTSAAYTKMIITKGGNVGIGTTTPARKFDVFGSVGGVIADFNGNGSLGLVDINANSGGQAGLRINLASTQWTIGQDGTDSGKLKFTTGSSPSAGGPTLVLDRNGNVGIGTSSPSRKLEVSDSSGAYLRITDPDQVNSHLELHGGNQGSSWPSINTGGNWSRLDLGVAGGTNITMLSSGGNVGIGTTSPIAKLAVSSTAGGTSPLFSVASTTSGAPSTAFHINQFGQAIINGTSVPNTWSQLTVTNGDISVYDNQNTARGVSLFRNGTVLGGFNTTNNMPSFFATAGFGLDFVVNQSTQAMRVLSNGNVGIGTTSPASKLDVNGAIALAGTVKTFSEGDIFSQYDGSSGSSYPIIARYWDNNGSFESGTYIFGNGTNAKVGIEKPGSSEISAFTVRATLSTFVRTSDGAPVRIQDSNGYCEINPTSTTWTCTSDARLKKDIVALSATSSLDMIAQLRPVSFKWQKQTSSENRYGLVAQEVETIFPELVTTDSNGFKSVSYGSFTPFMLSAIQELNIKVEALSIVPEDSMLENVSAWATQKLGAVTGYFKNIFAGRVTTKELCLEDVCVTKDQLKTLLQNNGTAAATIPTQTQTQPHPQQQNSASTTPTTSTEPVVEEVTNPVDPIVEPVEPVVVEETTVEEVAPVVEEPVSAPVVTEPVGE
jgi:hypothetical protein